jgi:lipopolysaccharide export LptBFGC system permease protein LptF
MKLILQRYLLKEFIRIFIPALAVLEFLLILGMALQSMHKGVNVTALAELAPHIFFYSLPIALPVALLATTVITYGRLSGDNELWAMLTSGVHLWILILPVALLGLFFSLVSVGLHTELLPKSYRMLKVLQEKAVHQIVAQHLGVAQGKMRFPPHYIYIKSAEGNVFKDIIIMETSKEGVSSLILAEGGSLTVDADNNLILFALKNGRFIRTDPKSQVYSPTVVSFDDTLFRVSLGLSEFTRFKKYASLGELLDLKKKVRGEVKAMKDVPRERKLSRRAVKNRTQEAEGAYQNVIRERSTALLQAGKSQEIIANERKRLENLDNENNIAENYIRIAEAALGDLLLSKELSSPTTPQQGGLKEKDVKVKDLTQTIEKERLRIKEIEEQKQLSEKTIELETQNINTFMARVESLKTAEAEAEAEYNRWKKVLELREKIDTQRDIVIAIHRRLSPAFSCLTFVLVGIPIGIITRRGNILIGFFVSFLVVLLIYYPLEAAGKVLAADVQTPVIPTVWGPNLVITAIAAVLLVRVFRK